MYRRDPVPGRAAGAYGEIRRVLKPGGRVVLTCWEPLDRNDERLSLWVRRANLSAGLHQAGFTDVEVRDRPSWLAREHALWEATVTLAPGDDPALRSFHAEGVKSLQWTALLRRVLAAATNPQSALVRSQWRRLNRERVSVPTWARQRMRERLAGSSFRCTGRRRSPPRPRRRPGCCSSFGHRGLAGCDARARPVSRSCGSFRPTRPAHRRPRHRTGHDGTSAPIALCVNFSVADIC